MKIGNNLLLYFLTTMFFTVYLTNPVHSEESNSQNKPGQARVSKSSVPTTISAHSEHQTSQISSFPERSYQKSPAERHAQGDIYPDQPNCTTVITIGMYPIRKNRSAAKQNATNDALKEAVEKAVIRMMSRVELTANLNLIYDAVHNNAEKFIVTYRVVGEFSRKGNSIVALESQINTDALVQFFYQKGAIDDESKSSENGGDAIAISSDEKINGFKTIKAKIEGTDYLSSFIMLRKTLNSMNGIRDVQTKELTAEQAVVSIVFNGDGKTLARELMLNAFDDFGLVLSDITAESLTMHFIPKSNGPPLEKKDVEDAYISE